MLVLLPSSALRALLWPRFCRRVRPSGRRVSVSHPLAGNAENQLDADDRRYRAERHRYDGYGAAEHRPLRVPEPHGRVNLAAR